MIQRTWSEIPYATEQGIISKEQRILAPEQGFCLRNPKSSPDEVFGTHRGQQIQIRRRVITDQIDRPAAHKDEVTAGYVAAAKPR